MGYTFSLVLNREMADNELNLLLEGCSGATSSPDKLPTNAEIPVTRIDFDDTVSPSLQVAIESALEAVKRVPDLTVPALNVPAQQSESSPLPDEKTGGEP
jgi:hypothetical protein